MDGILLAALSVWAFMTLSWVVSVIIKNVSIVDNIYSLNFIWIALAYLLTTQNPTNTQLIITACTTIWALRLMIHLTYRSWGNGEDHRYARFRNMYGKERYWWFSYFQVFILQSLFVWVFALPIHLSAFITTQASTLLTIIGVSIFLFGFMYEAVADYQLLQFKKTRTQDQLLTSGLWKHSRHPNHFGEIMLWTGIATLCFAQSQTLGLLAYFSPIAITLTLVYLSGSVQQEPRMSKNKRNFEDYLRNTPNILPRIF